MKNEATAGSSPDLKGTGDPLKGVGRGVVRGEVLRWKGSISFLGDVNPDKGTLSKDDMIFDIKNKVLVFEEGAGSTVGSYVVYNLSLSGNAPLAMIMAKADAIITIGCILADIPLLNRVERQVMDGIATGDIIEMDPVSGSFSVWKVNRKRGNHNDAG
jgi:hypothetical protein